MTDRCTHPPSPKARRAIRRINGALGIESAITHRGDELKCSVIDDDDGGRRKAYFTADDCAQLSEAFAAIADELRERT